MQACMLLYAPLSRRLRNVTASKAWSTCESQARLCFVETIPSPLYDCNKIWRVRLCQGECRKKHDNTPRTILTRERDCLQVPHHLDLVGPPKSICRNANQEPMLRDLHRCYFSSERLQRSVRFLVEPLGKENWGTGR